MPPSSGFKEKFNVSSETSIIPDLNLFTNLTEHELEIVQDLEDLYIQEDQNAVFMCEVSLEDVTGEWYKDGHKIRPTSTIKIRTEGQKRNGLIIDETG